jgi:hypothetical protein
VSREIVVHHELEGWESVGHLGNDCKKYVPDSRAEEITGHGKIYNSPQHLQALVQDNHYGKVAQK